jgi:hypothetical protein
LAFGIAGCKRDTPITPKPKTETSQPPAGGTTGGPGSTEGGLKGNPAGGTPNGAATASTPGGMAPGASTSQTDRGGLASRPTERPQSGGEARPNAGQK